MDDEEPEVESSSVTAAAAGEATSSWGPSKPVTALPLQSFNLSYPAGSSYITPRLLMMNPNKGSVEEQDEDMCYMGADGDGSVVEGEPDMGYSSSCTTREESESVEGLQGEASSSKAGGSCEISHHSRQQQQGEGEDVGGQVLQRGWEQSRGRHSGYKAAGSRVADILSEEEVLQGSPDLPDSGGVAADQRGNSSKQQVPQHPWDSSSAEGLLAEGITEDEVRAGPHLLVVAPGASPELSNSSGGPAGRSLGNSICSSLPTPGQGKPGGWVRGSGGCSWGEDAARAVMCSRQGTDATQQQQQQQALLKARGEDMVKERSSGQAVAATAAVTTTGLAASSAADQAGWVVATCRGSREGSARPELPNVLVIARSPAGGKFSARNSYSSPSTSTGASGVARSIASDRVWRSTDVGRASRGSKEGGSASSTPGTRGPASPFSPRPPSWGVERLKEENDVLLEQLQVRVNGNAVQWDLSCLWPLMGTSE